LVITIVKLDLDGPSKRGVYLRRGESYRTLLFVLGSRTKSVEHVDQARARVFRARLLAWEACFVEQDDIVPTLRQERRGG
jgi:hypothetical protein